MLGSSGSAERDAERLLGFPGPDIDLRSAPESRLTSRSPKVALLAEEGGEVGCRKQDGGRATE